VSLFDSVSTRKVVWFGFAGAAAVCTALAGVGIWSTASMHKADAELQSMQDLSLDLVGSVAGASDLILTAGSKSAREGLGLRLGALHKHLAEQPPEDAQVKQAIDAAMQQLDVMSKIAKPSPDNDDSMIAYGKLAGLSEAAVSALDAVVAQKASAAAQAAQMLRWVMLGAGAAALILVILCGAAVQRRLDASLGGELEYAQALMQRAGQGDLSPIALSQQVSPKSVIGALATMVNQLHQSLEQVQVSASQISSASSQISAGSKDLSQRTEMNAASLQQTASAMEEFGSTLAHTAASARTAQQLSATASAVAERGGSVVSQVVSTMNDIQSSSNKIGDIIGTVDAIAFQTNILALNAAVEAARAGESGRGFAVVASEVRVLAQRSAEAARQIKSLVIASGQSVESGTRLVSSAGETMQEILQSVQRVSDVVSEISSATAEQTAGIGQVSGSVAQLDQSTQQNAAMVEQSAAAASSLMEQAQALTAVVNTFKLESRSVAV
jgi:methyl-accepting chemotaxis protein